MEQIKWPKETNADLKINLVADKVNELVRAYNTAANGLVDMVCLHLTARKTKAGTWYCGDCNKFIKAPHGQ